MGLKGSYNFKGIVIGDAYLQVDNVRCHVESYPVHSLVTAAVLNDDHTVQTPAVYATTYTKHVVTSSKIRVFKDKAARDATPITEIDTFDINFEMNLADSGKNCIKQAYLALKAMEAYTDYTDK